MHVKYNKRAIHVSPNGISVYQMQNYIKKGSKLKKHKTTQIKHTLPIFSFHNVQSNKRQND